MALFFSCRTRSVEMWYVLVRQLQRGFLSSSQRRWRSDGCLDQVREA
jgi:hypothetical protein